ncbi:glycosyltransferase [Sphingobacterium sp. 2149]|uniref:glycosyltransferase n=1 Tax=Sphingobacterium sp. 2149 TaxID=2817763 RepID=UPI0028678B7A|nr:glycosyltransferase [Sphingobacterium sp. 2149]MDR6733851.1 rhamnosyltransferase [Sphingobacterium sp. 2149]
MIDILLATYNGEKFLENQLLSIISQNFKDWRLVVHDDGSSDNTIAILRKYQSLDSRISIIEDGVVCESAAKNFLHLLSYVTSEYIIFCDQDDIWFESKLQVLFDLIKNESGPAAAYCNAYAYNGINITKNKITLYERDSLENSLFLNGGIQGCSLMFNRALLDEVIDFPDDIFMHDHFITMAAVSFGKVIYSDHSLMLYRQHANNVTGNVPITTLDRIRSFIKKDVPIIDRHHYEANKSFYIKYRQKLTPNQDIIFKAYLRFPDMNFMRKIFTIIRYNFRIGDHKAFLLLKIFFKRAI